MIILSSLYSLWLKKNSKCLVFKTFHMPSFIALILLSSAHRKRNFYSSQTYPEFILSYSSSPQRPFAHITGAAQALILLLGILKYDGT